LRDAVIGLTDTPGPNPLKSFASSYWHGSDSTAHEKALHEGG
jgi:hypothetical protein